MSLGTASECDKRLGRMGLMGSKQPLMGVLCALFLLAGGLAEAAPQVLYGPGVSEADAQAAVKGKLDDPVFAGLIWDRLDVGGNKAVVVGAPAERCTKESPRPLRGELLVVRTSMLDMEYGGALDAIDAIASRIACYAEDASPDDLYELYFLRGMAAFNEDKPAEARKSFGQAAALDPSRAWPSEYPPTAQTVYLDALRDAVAKPPAALVREVEGGVSLNGAADDGTPRLLVGGHLLWAESSNSGLWITVPAAGVPEEGVILTTAVKLMSGLLSGNNRYAPWLSALAAQQGWDEVALVSMDGVVVFRGGAFFGLDGKPIKQIVEGSVVVRPAPKPTTIAGMALLGVGAGTAAAGLGLNLASFDQGLPEVGQLLPDRADYEDSVTQNRAGLGLIGAGAGVAVAGIVIAVVGVAKKTPEVAAVPWLLADETQVTFGIAGRLP